MGFYDRNGQFLRKSNFERRVWKPLRMERLGHSSIKLSMDEYSHLMAEMQNIAAGHFDAITELKP